MSRRKTGIPMTAKRLVTPGIVPQARGNTLFAPSLKRHRLVRQEGIDAFTRGADVGENPYPKDLRKWSNWKAWRIGYFDAKTDQARREFVKERLAQRREDEVELLKAMQAIHSRASKVQSEKIRLAKKARDKGYR